MSIIIDNTVGHRSLGAMRRVMIIIVVPNMLVLDKRCSAGVTIVAKLIGMHQRQRTTIVTSNNRDYTR